MTSPRHQALLVLAAICSLLVIGLSVPATATSAGKVTGVIQSSGKALPGVRVELTQTQDDGDVYDTIAHTTTSTKGTYSFSNILVSDFYGYRVKVVDPAHGFVSTIRDFNPKAGKTVTRNVTMKRAGSITGTVTRDDGEGNNGLYAILEGPDVEIGTPDTIELAYESEIHPHTNGKFTFVGLPAGDYAVQFVDPGGKYLGQCYDNTLTKSESNWPSCAPDVTPEATHVTLSGGETKALATQTLTHRAARISGTVTDTAGNAVKGIDLTAFPEGDGTTNGPLWDDTSHTNSTFTIGSLPAGAWQLRVEDTGDIWSPQWFDRVGTQAKSKAITVREGQRVDDIAVRLKSRSSLRATATPGKGTATFDVSIVRAAGGKPGGTVTATYGSKSRSVTLVRSKGTVKLTGLPKGRRTFTLRYSGTSSTSSSSRILKVTVN